MPATVLFVTNPMRAEPLVVKAAVICPDFQRLAELEGAGDASLLNHNRSSKNFGLTKPIAGPALGQSLPPHSIPCFACERPIHGGSAGA